MKYRRKSKIVDAELFNEKTVQRCKDFVGSALFYDKDTGKYYIKIAEGNLVLPSNSYIVKTKDSYEAWKVSFFEDLFEPLESDDASFGMTLDEAIQYCEEVAKKNEEESALLDIDDNLSDMFQENLNKCRQCGMEHRQLANWLEQLKQYRIVIQRIKEDIESRHSNTGSADSAFGRNCMIKKALAIIDKNLEPITQLENQFKLE